MDEVNLKIGDEVQANQDIIPTVSEANNNSRGSEVKSDLFIPTEISDQYLEKLVNFLSDEHVDKVKSLIREKETRDNECLIEKLPKEMWMMILNFLDHKDLVSLSKTSKSFKTLSQDPKLWKQTSWTVTPQELLQCPESYAALFSRLAKLNYLKIEQLFEDGFEHGKGHMKLVSRMSREKLKSSFDDVDFSNLKLEIDLLEDFELEHLSVCTTSFRNLKAIDFGFSSLEDIHVEAIAKSCSNLREFNSDLAKNLTDSGVKSLAENCPKLTKFSISESTWEEIPGVTNDGIISLVSKCSRLIDLYVGNADNVTDEAIKKIGEHCPDLEELGLGYLNITDNGVDEVVTKCIKLRALCLREAGITDRTLELLGKHCPDMEDLELDCSVRVTEAGVRYFVEQGSKPLSLNINYGTESNGREVEYMAKLRREYPRLTKIEDDYDPDGDEEDEDEDDDEEE